MELLVVVLVVMVMMVVVIVLAVVVLLLEWGRSPVVVPISGGTTSRRKLGIDAGRRCHRRRSVFGFSLITVTKRFATTRTFFLISRESLLSTRLKSSRSKTRRLQALLGGDSSTFDLHSLLGQVLPQVVVVFVSHKNKNTHQNSHYTCGTKLGALLRRCPDPWT